MNLLKRHKTTPFSRAFISLLRKSAFALANLAHENSSIKTNIRMEGGIQPLVELLEQADPMVQKSAACALRILAFENDENKNQIIECNTLPTLIFMLRSEDPSTHDEAVGTLGNLVHSSPKIMEEVLAEGALQPVIGLLSSFRQNSRMEAALLIGQFAKSDSDCKVRIVQRGAVSPLVEMLKCNDIQLKEMAAFALSMLAQDMHNQAGIVHDGSLLPLLELIDSKNDSLQSHAAFALYGIAANEDNISDFIKVGGVQTLQNGEFTEQATKDRVEMTLHQIGEKLNGRVLRHLVNFMKAGDRCVQRRVALALVHLSPPEDQKRIFLDNNGLDLFLGLLMHSNAKEQHDWSVILYQLMEKVMILRPLDSPPSHMRYLSEDGLNMEPLSDVTFCVEDMPYYALKMALCGSSDVFAKMLNGRYREKEVGVINIPNLSWKIFDLMMRFAHIGSVEIDSGIAQELLRAADEYLLEGLKRSCEYAIAKDVHIENISAMYEFSEVYNAAALKLTCILFILKNFSQINSGPTPGQSPLVQRIIPDIRIYMNNALQGNNH